MKETPIHRAARRSFYPCYQLLKAHGALENIQNLMGETPRDVLLDKWTAEKRDTGELVVGICIVLYCLYLLVAALWWFDEVLYMITQL
jgi:hypothetical protein